MHMSSANTVFILLAICGGSLSLPNSNGILPAFTIAGKPKVVIELAIFYDAEFSNAFQGDNQKLLNYWRQIIWNVDLRFRTLGSVEVSFRVNSIVQLQKWEQQEITKDILSFNDTFLREDILSNFGKWLYKKAARENFNSYDVAVLAMRSKLTDSDFKTVGIGRLCSVDTNNLNNLKIGSAVAISMDNLGLSVDLAHELGHLFGAPHDDNQELYQSNNCEDFATSSGKYIMGKGKYFFSPCSQKSISRFLESDEASCLKQLHANATPLIDTSIHCGKQDISCATSLEDQCKNLVDYSESRVTLHKQNACLKTECHINFGNGSFVGHTTFDPLDFTSCEMDGKIGQCFFGSCIPSGTFLVNVASEKCVGNRNPFSFDNSPVLYDCLERKSSYPWNYFEVKYLTSEGRSVTAISVNSAMNGTVSNCLHLGKNGLPLTFKPCKDDFPEIIWELQNFKMSANSTFGSFNLYHPLSQSCLTIAENSDSLSATTFCTQEDTKQQWMFIKDSEMPVHPRCFETQQITNVTTTNGTQNRAQLHFLVATFILSVWFLF